MHFKRQKSQTNAASATLYPPMNLRTHLKVHSANAIANAADVILHLSRQAIKEVV